MTVDLPLDLNTQDETGLPWAFLDEAPDPSRIVQGSWIVPGGPTGAGGRSGRQHRVFAPG